LDQFRRGYIDKPGIGRYMIRIGCQLLPRNLSSIVRRLDVNGDGKITFDEFIEAFTPVSPFFP